MKIIIIISSVVITCLFCLDLYLSWIQSSLLGDIENYLFIAYSSLCLIISILQYFQIRKKKELSE